MDIRISINDGKKHVTIHLIEAEKYLNRLPGLESLIYRAHTGRKDADKVEITAENADELLPEQCAVQTSAPVSVPYGGWPWIGR